MTPSQQEIDDLVIASHFNLQKVKEILSETPSILNENAEWLETPIQAASHVGNTDIVDYLLSVGAPMDICTATLLGKTDDVRAMLADQPELIHARGAHDIPLLYFAAIGHQMELARELISAGAEVNGPEGGIAPLHGAARRGYTDMVQLLLDAGADPYATDIEGHLAYDLAKAGEHVETVELLKTFLDAEDQ